MRCTVLFFRIASVFLSMEFVLTGCSSTPAAVRWINPDVLAQYSASQRTVRDEWAKKIGDLPIELHGSLPNQSFLSTTSMIKNVMTYDADTSAETAYSVWSTQQRVVLYINGSEVPQRRDFCALNKKLRTPPLESQMVALRGAVCDGQKIVTYARDSEKISAYQAGNINAQIDRLKQSLIAALYPAPTTKEIRDIGVAPEL